MAYPSFPGVDTSFPEMSLQVLTQRLQTVATAINRLNQGKTNVVKLVSLTPSAAATSVKDSRLTPFSGVNFDPLTANAAAEKAAGTMYVAEGDRRRGTWTVTHADNVQSDRDFRMVILG